MTREKQLEAFSTWTERLGALRTAMTVMDLDENGAPEKGAAFRGRQRGILAGEYRRMLHDPAFFDLLEELRREELPGDTARCVELYYDQLRKEGSVPPEAYTALEEALFRSRKAWLRAKQEQDFAPFAPVFQQVVDCERSIAEAWQGGGSVYDKLLEENQPGWNQRRYDHFFAAVKEGVLPLLAEIQAAPPVREDFLYHDCSIPLQRQGMEGIRAYLGFDSSWGRLSESEHPLTSVVCAGDVRFTTKYRAKDVVQAVFSTVHESGHAWHAHNIDPAYDGGILAVSTSAGLCESQSRLCENHLGRSLPFWQVHFPAYQRLFPQQLAGVTPEEFYRGVNRVKPTLIRTEADEVTYPLHILIRYELEQQMMDGGLDVSQLEEAWNEKYQEYLGVVPTHPAEGVLQDMHWAWGYFGYFPTYALGSAMAAQFFAAMERELNVEQLLLEGKYQTLMEWLGSHIHRYGNRYEADELLCRVTGETLGPGYYLQWLHQKYRALYQLGDR